MSSYFGLVVLYPLVSVILGKIYGVDSSIWSQIKNEFYLWFFYTIAYAGFLFIMLIPKVVIGALASFMIYTIGYFAISIARKGIYAGKRDTKLFSKSTT